MADARTARPRKQVLRIFAIQKYRDGVSRVGGRFHILHVSVIAAQDERILRRVHTPQRGAQKPVQVRQNSKSVVRPAPVPDMIGMKKFIDQQIRSLRQLSKAAARLLCVYCSYLVALPGDAPVRVVSINGSSVKEIVQTVERNSRAFRHHRGYRTPAASATRKKTRRICVGEPDERAPLPGTPEQAVSAQDMAQPRVRQTLTVPPLKLGRVHAREQRRPSRRALGDALNAETGVRLDKRKTLRRLSAQRAQRRLRQAGERISRPRGSDSQAVHKNEENRHVRGCVRRPLRTPSAPGATRRTSAA